MGIGEEFGLVYDGWGRVTALPAALSPAQTPTTLSYRVNDLAASATTAQGAVQWSLDAAGRLACARRLPAGGSDSADCGASASAGVVDTLEHYGDERSDSPMWSTTRTGSGSVQHTWYAAGLDGSLAATVTTNPTGGAGTVSYQLADLHGDLTTTSSPDPVGGVYDGQVSAWDVWGNQLQGAAARHGWLGGKQRPQDPLTGLTLMGVRLYNPATGRFLQPDPVYGGNDNTYTYPPDPINKYDLDGRIAAVIWLVPLAWEAVVQAAVVVTVVLAAAAAAQEAYIAFGSRADENVARDEVGKYDPSQRHLPGSRNSKAYCKTFKECKAAAKQYAKKQEGGGRKVTVTESPRVDGRYGLRPHVVVKTVWRSGKRAVMHFILK